MVPKFPLIFSQNFAQIMPKLLLKFCPNCYRNFIQNFAQKVTEILSKILLKILLKFWKYIIFTKHIKNISAEKTWYPNLPSIFDTFCETLKHPGYVILRIFPNRVKYSAVHFRFKSFWAKNRIIFMVPGPGSKDFFKKNANFSYNSYFPKCNLWNLKHPGYVILWIFFSTR